ncbi:GNAT family N-acetyltransferase [Tundrisphaera lichenicola]|uniref:GNAT family N-acetyltransferase n=1 Tax=Tundrisphaera lichenicola TaxID=2029860 RepID=UPI003EC0C369
MEQPSERDTSRKLPVIFNPNYMVARSCLIEGTDIRGTRPGNWPITAARVRYGWGNVSVGDWPFSNEAHWYQDEPEGLDEKAKLYRAKYYRRICGLDECRHALKARRPVEVSFAVTEAWFNAERGEIPEFNSEADIVGTHHVALVGYSDDRRRLKFVNSWGPEWGDRGIGTISCDYYEKWSREAWLIDAGLDSRQIVKDALGKVHARSASPDGPLELMWAIPDELNPSTPIHCREIFDYEHDERIGWAFATTSGGFLEIEDFFVRPAYRRQGYATRIARMLSDFSLSLGLPMKLLVTFADAGPENHAAIHGLLRLLRLTLRESNRQDLAYVALSGASSRTLESITIPEKPTLYRGSPLERFDDPEVELSSRLEAERITPSNEQLRALIGKFEPPSDMFAHEEMPF